MKRFFFSTFGLAMFLVACTETTSADNARWPDRIEEQVGQTYEIRWSQSTETSDGNGSSGSSNTKTLHIERVLGANADELILEYDMSADVSDIDRRRYWQLPARIRLTPNNEMSLLNAAELKARNDDWLDWGGYDLSHCGKWFFTWVAQKIECDPESVLDMMEVIQIRRTNLENGAEFTVSDALSPSQLIEQPSEEGLTVLKAILDLDPETIRLNRAKNNLVMAEIMGDEIPTLEEALETLQGENISGTIEVVYTLNSTGEPIRSIQVTQTRVENIQGGVEISKTKETIEKTLIDGRDD